MFFKKNKDEGHLRLIKNTEEVVCEDDKEWIWVDGYKGMSADMTCKNNFQYKIGSTYEIIDSECVSYGRCGFHFCKTIDNVVWNTNYDNPLEYRFFKVKGLINKTQKDMNAYVAKKIHILEEISDEEYFNIMKFEWINNIEDFVRYKGKPTLEIADMVKKMRINQLIDMGYSETFSCVLANRIEYLKSFCVMDISCGQDLIDKAKALKDEGVSIDMCAYLLLS